MCLSQLVFADEVWQDSRGSRRRNGWGEVGAGCNITEFLNRGKRISILALYGITGFIDFDHKEGGYSAEDFIRGRVHDHPPSSALPSR